MGHSNKIQIPCHATYNYSCGCGYHKITRDEKTYHRTQMLHKSKCKVAHASSGNLLLTHTNVANNTRILDRNIPNRFHLSKTNQAILDKNKK